MGTQPMLTLALCDGDTDRKASSLHPQEFQAASLDSLGWSLSYLRLERHAWTESFAWK